MSSENILLDPTSEMKPVARELLPRPKSRKGKVVGLLDISKPRGNVLLDRLEEKLTELGAEVKRYAKPTFTRVAPVDLKQQITTQCNVVIEALAD